MGCGALGRGLDKISWMALFKCFFPMYPLGHNVSDISSTGMTRDDDDDDDDEENWFLIHNVALK